MMAKLLRTVMGLAFAIFEMFSLVTKFTWELITVTISNAIMLVSLLKKLSQQEHPAWLTNWPATF